MRALGMRDGEGYALWGLGNALAGLGEHAGAAEAFNAAIAVERALGMDALVIEAVAGLARVAVAQGDHAAALAHVEAILVYLDGGGSLDLMEVPGWVYHTCYEVLSLLGHPGARDIARDAHQFLQARAAKLPEGAPREQFLERVPHHAALVTAWRTEGAVGAA